jgi:hypothetical protein
VADRQANTNSTTAGADYAYVYAMDFEVKQPHDAMGSGNTSSSQSHAQITLVLPDYEPLTVGALNVLKLQDNIKKLTLNTTARQGSGDKVLAQFQGQNGVLIDYGHTVRDQRLGEHLKHRGEVKMVFRFETYVLDNKVTNSSATFLTTAS